MKQLTDDLESISIEGGVAKPSNDVKSPGMLTASQGSSITKQPTRRLAVLFSLDERHSIPNALALAGLASARFP